MTENECSISNILQLKLQLKPQPQYAFNYPLNRKWKVPSGKDELHTILYGKEVKTVIAPEAMQSDTQNDHPEYIEKVSRLTSTTIWYLPSLLSHRHPLEPVKK